MVVLSVLLVDVGGKLEGIFWYAAVVVVVVVVVAAAAVAVAVAL